MNDLSGILRDARIEELPSFLNVKTQAASESIAAKTAHWATSEDILEKRAFQARCLKSALRCKGRETALQAKFADIAAVEPTVREFLQEDSELEKEGYSQLLFTSEFGKCANHIPYFLAAWTFMKLWLFPVLAISMPILTIIGPYIVIKYVMGLPLTLGQYINMAKGMYLGGGAGAGAGAATGTLDIKNIFHIGLFCMTTVQSMYQPLQTAIHLRNIDATLREKGTHLIRFIRTFRSISDDMGVLGIRVVRLRIPDEAIASERLAYSYFLDHRSILKVALELVGSWEVAVAMASHPQICAVKWLKQSQQHPYMYIKDTCDTGIHQDKQRTFSIILGSRPAAGGPVQVQQKHALLTGPNRGGKSTVLRAILRSAVLSHTYGVAIGHDCLLTPLDWIQSSLRIEDLPGTASLFEREVNFAKTSLRRPEQSRGLVCIDELFHSTNPPDAEAASREYLTSLWSRSNILSVISTHIFPLVKSAPSEVKRLCCPATISDDGVITYNYGLQRGICEVSSVREIIGDAFAAK